MTAAKPPGRPEGPMPDNSSYMVAAYVVAGVLYGGYTLWLLLRGRARD